MAVHDAVRPFIDLETIHSVIDEAAETGAAIVGIVPVDTVKQVSRAHRQDAQSAPPCRARSWCWRRRPRFSATSCCERAFEAARRDGFIGTDESSLVERLDVEVSVVLGSDRNIKITRPSDMDLARLFLDQETAHSEAAG